MWRYYAFKIAGLTFSHLPRRIGYMLAWLAGNIVYLVAPKTRADVADNIRHVLGAEVDKATLRKTVRGVLINMAKNYFDLIKLPHLKFKAIERSVAIHGSPHLEEAIKEGRGIMLVTAHLGSFDMTAQMLAAHSIRTTILVELLEPPVLFQHVVRLRESKGLTFAPVRPGVAKDILQCLRRGEVVVVACDRDIQNDGQTFKFFGRETSMPVGAITLAIRAEASVIPVFNLRRADGRYDIFIEPPIEMDTSGKDGLVESMEQVVAAMEQYIRKSPEQWVVLSRVWGNGR